MSGELVSLRLLLVAAEPAHAALWRESIAQASVPIEFDACDAPAARAALKKGGVDICVMDDGLDDADKASVIAAARAKEPEPLVFVSGPRGSARPDNIDGTLAKPADLIDARKAVEICIRARLPTRVLIVDDSATMRSIVRKILAASRFDLDIHEAAESGAAFGQLRNGNFAVVFLDYNMPGLNGADILAAIKRASAQVAVVMMTTAVDKDAPVRPHLAGTLAFLKKPFFPADVDRVFELFYGLRERDAS
ncbi:MAG: response regulator [Pseudolabrys sp.]